MKIKVYLQKKDTPIQFNLNLFIQTPLSNGHVYLQEKIKKKKGLESLTQCLDFGLLSQPMGLQQKQRLAF